MLEARKPETGNRRAAEEVDVERGRIFAGESRVEIARRLNASGVQLRNSIRGSSAGSDHRRWRQRPALVGVPRTAAARVARTADHRSGEGIRGDLPAGARLAAASCRRIPARLRLLQRIRDEAHRFANTYHQLLMKKRIGESILDDCPGVSQNRKNLLLRKFGSVNRLRKATVEQIAATEGIGAEAGRGCSPVPGAALIQGSLALFPLVDHASGHHSCPCEFALARLSALRLPARSGLGWRCLALTRNRRAPRPRRNATPFEETIVPTFETQKLARTYVLDIPAPRGQITDRNGVPLAQNRLSYNLAISFPTPLDFSDAQVLAFAHEKIRAAEKLLGRSLKISDDLIMRHYRNRGILPFEIAQNLTDEGVRRASRTACPAGVAAASVLCAHLSERTDRGADHRLQRKDRAQPGRHHRQSRSALAGNGGPGRSRANLQPGADRASMGNTKSRSTRTAGKRRRKS